MEGLESMMRQVMGRSSAQEKRVIFGEELEEFRQSFKKIDGLKPGDKVRWRSKSFQDSYLPETGEVVEVFAILPPKEWNREIGSNHFTDEPDFTFVYMANGIYYESAADSRRFVRVE